MIFRPSEYKYFYYLYSYYFNNLSIIVVAAKTNRIHCQLKPTMKGEFIYKYNNKNRSY